MKPCLVEVHVDLFVAILCSGAGPCPAKEWWAEDIISHCHEASDVT